MYVYTGRDECSYRVNVMKQSLRELEAWGWYSKSFPPNDPKTAQRVA